MLEKGILDPSNQMHQRLIYAITFGLQDHMCIDYRNEFGLKGLRCPNTSEALAIAEVAIRPIEKFLEIYEKMIQNIVEKAAVELGSTIVIYKEKI